MAVAAAMNPVASSTVDMRLSQTSQLKQLTLKHRLELQRRARQA
jgi:hypothetical protein